MRKVRRLMFKKSSFNLLYFLLIFLFLKFTFTAYIGIISPGGKVYSFFLHNYANVPAWFTYFICKCAKGFLQILGYDVYQKALNNVTIRGARGVNIIWACLGFGVMSFWVAFVTAHAATAKYKFKWIAIGVALITCINIIRIALIALGLYHHWEAFIAVEPHFAFNVVSYIAIMALAFAFVVCYKKHDKNKPNTSLNG